MIVPKTNGATGRETRRANLLLALQCYTAAGAQPLRY
jgi:hypothetical protein